MINDGPGQVSRAVSKHTTSRTITPGTDDMSASSQHSFVLSGGQLGPATGTSAMLPDDVPIGNAAGYNTCRNYKQVVGSIAGRVVVDVIVAGLGGAKPTGPFNAPLTQSEIVYATTVDVGVADGDADRKLFSLVAGSVVGPVTRGYDGTQRTSRDDILPVPVHVTSRVPTTATAVAGTVDEPRVSVRWWLPLVPTLLTSGQAIPQGR